MCGEKELPACRRFGQVGSPPRVRGKDGRFPALRFRHRITPACAGKSAVLTGARGAGGDHPRVCGEKERTSRCSCWTEGSPPRVRGKVRGLLFSSHCARITPACAGKSSLSMWSVCRYRDHPRVCGEKTIQGPRPLYPRGSPPRVRGKEPQRIAAASRARITPACAGKSFARLGVLYRTRDHPRVCGEKFQFRPARRWALGSPPRVRGKEKMKRNCERGIGITPACAGKRALASILAVSSWDHPRVCGEKNNAQLYRNSGSGSPPRVRGKAGYLAIKRMDEGITPACAGKSAAITCRAWYPRDHPRVCGEK